MMENARPVVVSIDAAPPPSKSPAERGKKAAGKTKRCERKRKRPEKGEQNEEPAATAKTSSKKRPVQKGKTGRATAAKRVLTTRVSSKKCKGKGEVVRRQASQYRGVCWHKSNNKWIAHIKYDGKDHHIGYFEDEEEAAKAYDKAAREHHGEKAQLNCPTKKEQAAEEAKQQRWINCGEGGLKYRGVYWDKRSKKWQAEIRYDGKKHYLGSFEGEEGAAMAYDQAARAHKGENAQLNFPTKKEQAAEEAKQQRWIKCGEAGSKYRGVNWHTSANKWKAAIGYDGKKHYLGSFKDEEEAARAYDGAARAHHGEKSQLNFPAEGGSGSRKSSQYRGVFWAKGRSKWQAQIKYDGKRHHLGSFEDEEEAARVFDKAAKVHKGDVT
jgi:hypothetical protein